MCFDVSVTCYEKQIYSHFTLNSGKWMVLIDAAKGSATEPPDLSQYPADFVVMSFYKVLPGFIAECRTWFLCSVSLFFFFSINFGIPFLCVKLFGYPTGLGALIVRNG